MVPSRSPTGRPRSPRSWLSHWSTAGTGCRSLPEQERDIEPWRLLPDPRSGESRAPQRSRRHVTAGSSPGPSTRPPWATRSRQAAVHRSGVAPRLRVHLRLGLGQPPAASKPCSRFRGQGEQLEPSGRRAPRPWGVWGGPAVHADHEAAEQDDLDNHHRRFVPRDVGDHALLSAIAPDDRSTWAHRASAAPG
jgi:hypothetical protein